MKKIQENIIKTQTFLYNDKKEYEIHCEKMYSEGIDYEIVTTDKNEDGTYIAKYRIYE